QWLNAHIPVVLHEGVVVESRNGEELILAQHFIDCGQDGFTADDLLVGDREEGSAIMGMLNAAQLDCATSKCLLGNIPLFDKVEEFLSQSYIDPCTREDVISEEDLNDAISAACSGDGRHAANTFSAQINEALEGNPHIKLSKNLATDCPKLNCILNKLLG